MVIFLLTEVVLEGSRVPQIRIDLALPLSSLTNSLCYSDIGVSVVSNRQGIATCCTISLTKLL